MSSPGLVLSLLIVLASIGLALLISLAVRKAGERRPLVKELSTTSRRPGDIFFIYGVILGLILVTAGLYDAGGVRVGTAVHEGQAVRRDPGTG